jgi:hypothetical protein
MKNHTLTSINKSAVDRRQPLFSWANITEMPGIYREANKDSQDSPIRFLSIAGQVFWRSDRSFEVAEPTIWKHRQFYLCDDETITIGFRKNLDIL